MGSIDAFLFHGPATGGVGSCNILNGWGLDCDKQNIGVPTSQVPKSHSIFLHPYHILGYALSDNTRKCLRIPSRSPDGGRMDR